MADTTTLQIPSVDVPGVPAFAIEVSPGWRAEPAAGAVARLIDDRHPTRTITVTTLRVDSDTDLRDVAVRSFARQRSVHPDAQIRAQRTGRFGERLVYFREVTIAGTTPPITQIQALFLVESPSTRDAFSFVGSAPADDLEAFGPVFVDVIASFRRDVAV